MSEERQFSANGRLSPWVRTDQGLFCICSHCGEQKLVMARGLYGRCPHEDEH